MPNKLLIIDGHNLLFQMFLGMPSRIVNKDGIAIQGVIGFVGALGKLIKLINPTHAVIIFDSEGKNPKCELFPEYKANRPDYSEVSDEDNPFTQLPFIYRALDLIGIPYKEAGVYECDDIIAGYARALGNSTEVYISSYDSDYFQLVSNSVKCVRYKGDYTSVVGADDIKSKYGVEPGLFADYKALVGDTSDNIPGVRGIGPKTASRLLSTYGKLEDILENVEAIDDIKLREKISSERERLKLNMKLIKLDGSVPLPYTLDDIRIEFSEFKTTDIIRRIGL